ncbi:Salicylate hydroxylase, partial [Leucoagaricus sp. SymC.cos]
RGAGIAGLALAVALNAFDDEQKFAVDLYEAASELSETGAGINVWPRIWQCLKEIGLEETLIPLLDHYPDLEPRIVFEMRKADQENGFKITDAMKEGGILSIHRADFQRSFIEHLPLLGSNVKMSSICNLHLSHRLINYDFTATGHISLSFVDKPITTCDILVGADGIKSTVRRLFLTRLPNPEKYEMFLDPVWSGSMAYRELVDKNELKKIDPGHRALDHPGLMHCVVYPVSGGKFMNVVAMAHDKSKKGAAWEGLWNQEVTQEEFLEKFKGWEDEFQALIRVRSCISVHIKNIRPYVLRQCIPQPTRWALHDLNHLDVFANRRVFLLGDSVGSFHVY